MYEYGGFTNDGRDLSSPELGFDALVGVLDRAGRKSNGDGDVDNDECITEQISNLFHKYFCSSLMTFPEKS